MAGIDYGCVIKMNNIIYNTDEIILDGIPKDTEYFIKKIQFYKDCIMIFENDDTPKDTILPMDFYQYGRRGKKYRLKIKCAGIDFDIKRIGEDNRYMAKFTIDNNKYEVIYGYGVDIDLDLWYGKLTLGKKNLLNNWFTKSVVNIYKD